MGNVADLLAVTAPELRPVLEGLRRLARAALPGVTQTVDLPDRLLGYTAGPRLGDAVLAIVLHATHVNVQFPDGVDLDDPAGLLEGTGKRARHVKNRTPADVDRPALRDLIEAQWRLSRARIERGRAGPNESN